MKQVIEEVYYDSLGNELKIGDLICRSDVSIEDAIADGRYIKFEGMKNERYVTLCCYWKYAVKVDAISEKPEKQFTTYSEWFDEQSDELKEEITGEPQQQAEETYYDSLGNELKIGDMAAYADDSLERAKERALKYHLSGNEFSVYEFEGMSEYIKGWYSAGLAWKYAVKVDTIPKKPEKQDSVKKVPQYYDYNTETWKDCFPLEEEKEQSKEQKDSMVNQDFMDWFEQSWKMNNGKR